MTQLNENSESPIDDITERRLVAVRRARVCLITLIVAPTAVALFVSASMFSNESYAGFGDFAEVFLITEVLIIIPFLIHALITFYVIRRSWLRPNRALYTVFGGTIGIVIPFVAVWSQVASSSLMQGQNFVAVIFLVPVELVAAGFGYFLGFGLGSIGRDQGPWQTLLIGVGGIPRVWEDEILEALLHGGADVDYQADSRSTAYFMAGLDSQPKVVSALLENVKEADEPGNDGITALMIASAYGQRETVRILLKYIADVDVQANNGATALYLASLQGNDDIVEMLLENGANIEMQYEEGSTALDVAMNATIEEMLKDWG